MTGDYFNTINTGDYFNTINHVGMYSTKVRIRQDGSMVVEQTDKHGASDCVILPKDVVNRIVDAVANKSDGRAA
jgi:hypothetical protein